MKVTIENKKGLGKDIKVIVDKKTMDNYLMVGRKGLEPSPIARLVPKTSASTNSAIAPVKLCSFIYY